MKKRNYPKNRKSRLLTNTMTYKLEYMNDLGEVTDYFIKHGQYKTAVKFCVSAFIVRYLMMKHKIKRPLPPHLCKAYKNKTWPPKGRKMRTNYMPER